METTLTTHKTMEPRPSGPPRFAGTSLPWLLAALSFLLYVLTINPWVTLGSLPQAAKLAGFTWQPELVAPLFYLVTFPFRLLPVPYIPLALNSAAAVCAALALAFLARSVALLPQDRTIAQREKERSEYGLLSIPLAWVPVVMAVVVCGLQISFWQNATALETSPPFSASGHMFDLVLFAFVVRAVLEYRAGGSERWLTTASLVYGLAITNDWAMIAYFPIFITALIWIKRASFFEPRFLGRMVLWGAPGLLLYFLLPAIHAWAKASPVPFWFSFKTNLGGQLGILKTYFAARQYLLVLGLTSLLPLLLISIRWSSYFGDTSRTGAALTKVIFHFVHAFFLLACIWIAMDPPVSPHNQGLGVPFLSFYFLSALSVGYFTGYFLLVFGKKRSSRHARYTPSSVQAINALVTGLVLLLAVLTPVALLTLNLPRIRMTNGPWLEEYASRLINQLPKHPVVVMSDEAARLVLIQSALARKHAAPSYLFVDTAALKAFDYHQYLSRKFPERWPQNPRLRRTEPVPDVELLDMVAGLGRKEQVWYLHPSFGYYFEAFYPEPHGLVYRLQSYPTNNILPPSLSAEIVAENQSFWKKAQEESLQRLSYVTGPESARSGILANLMRRAHLKLAPPQEAAVLARWYSRSLNYWGTRIQAEGKFEDAASCYQLAYALNPDNVVANVNLQYNKKHVAGDDQPLPMSDEIREAFGKYRTWAEVLSFNGPYEEPAFCYSQGLQFQQGKNFRQAAHEFARALALYPRHITAGLGLANIYNLALMPSEALKVLDQIHANVDLTNEKTNLPTMVLVETATRLGLKDIAGAEQAVANAVKISPGDTNILEAATQMFFRYGAFSNACKFIEQELKLNPLSPNTLVSKGYALIQMGDFDGAIAPLTQALELGTNDLALINSAVFDRGLAYLQKGDLDKAAADYSFLLQSNKDIPQLYYGLGEIAYRKRDTNAALQNYEQYLLRAPAESEEVKLVLGRVQELKGGR